MSQTGHWVFLIATATRECVWNNITKDCFEWLWILAFLTDIYIHFLQINMQQLDMFPPSFLSEIQFREHWSSWCSYQRHWLIVSLNLALFRVTKQASYILQRRNNKIPVADLNLKINESSSTTHSSMPNSLYKTYKCWRMEQVKEADSVSLWLVNK